MDSLDYKQRLNQTNQAQLFGEEFIDYFVRVKSLEARVMNAADSGDKWKAIKRFYAFYQRAILTVPHRQWACDPYSFGWFENATPIEKAAWAEIRAYCLVLYPQFPIEGYFADFAHPKLKVALELDGKEFHDPVRDAIRDQKLISCGWTIYRVPGDECKRLIDPERTAREFGDDSDEHYLSLEMWALHTATGVIEAIARQYFWEGKSDHEDEDLASDPEYRRDRARGKFVQNCLELSLEAHKSKA